MRQIWIVEDDENIRDLTIYALEAAGFACTGFEDGATFFEALSRGGATPDLILLDIMLPGESGLEILRRLRADEYTGSLPVIMLTAKGNEADRVKGLNLGADDYVPKPFGVTELIARVNAVLRRTAETPKRGGILTFKNIAMDSAKRSVVADGAEITLTFMEFELLHYMLLNAGIVMSREKLMDAVWGYDYTGGSRTVDMHVKSLRGKMGAAGEHLKTVRNVGYKIGE